MKFFFEKEGISRRQFLKGAGILTASAIITGVFAKFGIDTFATSKNYIKQRAAGLYDLDEKMAIRKSHENPEIAEIYKSYLSPGEVTPMSEKAYHLLHTKYGKKIPELMKKLASYNAA